MRAVTVYLSSSPGPQYVTAIQELGRELARRDLTLVYGGAHRGLMGVLADATLAAGGRVIGVIPQALVDLEVAHTGLTELHVVETMHQRKAMMFSLADAFVVAPGGFGTLEEAFETLTGLQLGYHAKPLVFLDVISNQLPSNQLPSNQLPSNQLPFWPQLEAFLDHAVTAGVLLPGVRALFRTASSAAAALDALAAW